MPIVKKVKTVVKKKIIKEINWRKDPIFKLGERREQTLLHVAKDIISLNDSYIISSEEIKPFFISFDLGELPFCCGVVEIGALVVSDDHLDILEDFLKHLSNNKRGRTFIINTNGKDDARLYEEALEKCTDEWTLVKSFKNSSSGNIVKMWISNNE